MEIYKGSLYTQTTNIIFFFSKFFQNFFVIYKNGNINNIKAKITILKL